MLFYAIFLGIPFTLIALFICSYIILPFISVYSYKRKGMSTYFFPISGYLHYWETGLKSDGDCFSSFKKASKEFPGQKVLVTNLGPNTLFLLRDPQMIKEYLHKQHLYNKVGVAKFLKPLFGNGLSTAEGETWKHHRRIVSTFFNYESLKASVGIVQSTTKEFLDKLSPSEYKNFHVINKVQEITGEIVGRIFFGEKLNNCDVEGKPLTLHLTNLMAEVMKNSLTPSALLFGPKILRLFANYRRVMKKVGDFRNICLRIIEDKRVENTKSNDLLSSLLAAQASGDPDLILSDEDIVDEFIILFVSGMDTTGHLIAMTLYNIAKSTKYQQTLQEERNQTYNKEKVITVDTLQKMDELHCLLKETLRVYHPAPVTFDRTCIVDHKLLNLEVKKGTWVKPDFFSICFNEDYYEDPETFNPDRWKNNKQNSQKKDPYTFIPFSGGPRNCIGQHLAIIDSKVIISEFLEKFNFKLKEGYNLKMTFRFLYEPYDELLFELEPKF